MQQMRRVMARVLAVAMVFGLMATTATATTMQVAPSSSSAMAPLSVYVPTDYRNLNMTPGGDVTEMRFTWHSQSTTGSIRLYEAGGTTPLQTVNSRTRLLQSRSADTPWFPGVTQDYTVHQLTIEGLIADTDYEYVVVGATFESDRKTFTTGTDGEEFSFIVMGDPQIGVGLQSSHRDYEGWTNAMEIAAENTPDAEFVLSVGDQINSRPWVTTGSGDNELTARARSQHMHDILFAPPELHRLPLLPVIGNHESGAMNANNWLWHYHYNNDLSADNVRRLNNNVGTQFEIQFDYYVRWGNTLFLVLDSNVRTALAGARLTFIQNAIAENADATWIIAAFHIPPYSAFRATDNAEKAAIINNWLPTLEALGVDTVLSGHCHIYTRTHPLRASAPHTPVLQQNWLDADGNIVAGTTPTSAVLNPDGITYFAFNSASGSGYYNATAMANRHYIASYNQNFRRNYSVVNVTEHTIEVVTYQIEYDDASTRTLVDVFTIVRSDDGTVPADVDSLRQMEDEELVGMEAIAPEVHVYNHHAPATVEGLRLPAELQVETVIRNNQGGNTATIRNATGEYGRRVRPMFAEIIWDLDNIDYDPMLDEPQRFLVHGVIDLPGNVANSLGLPLTLTIEVTVGVIVQPSDGFFADFGDRWRFYGRTGAELFADAFNPVRFGNWIGGGEHPHGAPTPIGFGSPRADTGLVMASPIGIGTGAHQRGHASGAIAPVHTFTYFSRTFTLADDVCIASLGDVRGRHELDDSMILFLNGIEIYRANTGGNITVGESVDWSAFGGQQADAQVRSFTINADVSNRDTGFPLQNNGAIRMHDAASRTNLEEALRPSVNVLTAVVGNVASDSSDLWFNLELFAEFDDGCDCPPPALATVIVDGSNADDSGAGGYAAGSTITIRAGDAEEGYRFVGWTSAAGNIFEDAADATTRIFVTDDVAVTANFVPITLWDNDNNPNSWSRDYLVDAYHADLISTRVLASNIWQEGINRLYIADLGARFIEAQSGMSISDFVASRNSNTLVDFPDFVDIDADYDSDVYYLTRLNVIQGAESANWEGLKFLPYAPITRQEAAVLIGRMMTLFGGEVPANGVIAQADLPFQDTIPSWARGSVYFLYNQERSIMSNTTSQVHLIPDPDRPGYYLNYFFSPLMEFQSQMMVMAVIRTLREIEISGPQPREGSGLNFIDLPVLNQPVRTGNPGIGSYVSVTGDANGRVFMHANPYRNESSWPDADMMTTTPTRIPRAEWANYQFMWDYTISQVSAFAFRTTPSPGGSDINMGVWLTQTGRNNDVHFGAGGTDMPAGRYYGVVNLEEMLSAIPAMNVQPYFTVHGLRVFAVGTRGAYNRIDLLAIERIN